MLLATEIIFDSRSGAYILLVACVAASELCPFLVLSFSHSFVKNLVTKIMTIILKSLTSNLAF